jgi:hypothetical protein
MVASVRCLNELTPLINCERFIRMNLQFYHIMDAYLLENNYVLNISYFSASTMTVYEF